MRTMERKRVGARALEGLAALALAWAGCGDDDAGYSVVDAYYYPDDYYYPADLAYSDAYYADTWYGYPYPVASRLKGTAVSSALPGAALRDLARGQSVCPEHATVTTESVPSPCAVAGEAATLPSHTSARFDGCMLPNGGRLDGSIEVAATHTFSDAECGSETVVDVRYISTSTHLSYTLPGGARVVLPSFTRSGSFTRPLGARPRAIDVSVEGRIERFDPAGQRVAALALSGMQTFALLEEEGGYRVDGRLTMQDEIAPQTVSVTGVGVTLTDACCHPIGGTLEVARSEGETDAWSFGPGCGEISLDGQPLARRECF